MLQEPALRWLPLLAVRSQVVLLNLIERRRDEEPAELRPATAKPPHQCADLAHVALHEPNQLRVQPLELRRLVRTVCDCIGAQVEAGGVHPEPRCDELPDPAPHAMSSLDDGGIDIPRSLAITHTDSRLYPFE